MELPTCSTPAVAVKPTITLPRETSTFISARTAGNVGGRFQADLMNQKGGLRKKKRGPTPLPDPDEYY